VLKHPSEGGVRSVTITSSSFGGDLGEVVYKEYYTTPYQLPGRQLIFSPPYSLLAQSKKGGELFIYSLGILCSGVDKK